MTPERELGMILVGCHRDRFYSRPQEQVPLAVSLAAKVEPRFLAGACVTSCDFLLPVETTAALAASLYIQDKVLFAKVMPRLLKRFGAQFVRAYAWVARKGVVGRKINLSGHMHRRLFQAWFDEVKVSEIVFLSRGVDFGLLDALRCFRVRASTIEKRALLAHRHNLSFGWSHEIIGEVPEPSDPWLPGHYEEFMRSGEFEEWIPSQIPRLEHLAIGVDLSFSMRGLVRNQSAISVASMIALSLAKRNRSAHFLPFREEVVEVGFNSGDTIATNSARLCAACRGGSDCASVLEWLNKSKGPVSSVIILGDDITYSCRLREQWFLLKEQNPKCQLFCVGLAEGSGSHIRRHELDDVVHFQGFSDQGFTALDVLGHGVTIDNLAGIV